MNKILGVLYFLTACVSIILYPNFYGLRFVQIGMIAILFLVYQIVCIDKLIFSKDECRLLFLTLLFFFCSIIGAITSNGTSGILTSFVFLIAFITTLSSIKYGFNNQLLKGFFFCGLLSSIWIIIDAIQFYLFTREPLIWQVAPITKNPDAMGRPHPFLNLASVFGIPLYRPCGFSPDPGCSVTGITLAYVLYKEDFFEIKKRKLYDLIVFTAIIVSISKTSIFSLIMYFIIKKVPNYYIPMKNKKINFLVFLAYIELTCLFAIGLITPYTGDGNERHLKYFASLIYAPTSNLIYFLFGYGLTNTGIFFDNYVPWFSSVGNFKLENHICESTLTNIFLYGGLLGSFLWMFVFYSIIKSNNPKHLILLDIIIFLSFGYTISGSWLYFVLFSICLRSMKTYKLSLIK